MRRQRIYAALAVVSLAACHGSDVPVGVLDIRNPIPEPDPRYVDVVTPDVVIEPGEEKMLCYHVETTEELAVRGLGTHQARWGHHIGLFTSSEPRPNGTLEDCTDAESNAKLRWFVIAFAPLPDGYAIHVPSGTRYVMQFHYINTGDQPILVRDIARLRRAETEVTTWVSTWIATVFDLAIPPGPATLTWDCTIDRPYELMIVSGHMHESGRRFSVELEDGVTAARPLYAVDPWEAAFRDTAPVTSFYDRPLPLNAGSVLRTSCHWNNRSDRTIGFPEEMCTLFAYVAGAREQVQCTPAVVD